MRSRDCAASILALAALGAPATARAELRQRARVDLTAAAVPDAPATTLHASATAVASDDGRAWIAWTNRRSTAPTGQGDTVYLARTDAALAVDSAGIQRRRRTDRDVESVSLSSDGTDVLVFTALGSTSTGRPTIEVNRGDITGAGIEILTPGGSSLVAGSFNAVLVFAVAPRIPRGADVAFLEVLFDRYGASMPGVFAGVARATPAFGRAEVTLAPWGASNSAQLCYSAAGDAAVAVTGLQFGRPDANPPMSVPWPMSGRVVGLAALPAGGFLVATPPDPADTTGTLRCFVGDANGFAAATPPCALPGFPNDGLSLFGLAATTDRGPAGTAWVAGAVCGAPGASVAGGVIVGAAGGTDAPLHLPAPDGYPCCMLPAITAVGTGDVVVTATCSNGESGAQTAERVFAWSVTRAAGAGGDAGSDAGGDAGSDAGSDAGGDAGSGSRSGGCSVDRPAGRTDSTARVLGALLACAGAAALRSARRRRVDPQG